MTAKRKSKTEKTSTFEASLQELEVLVGKMEDGELELDDALQSFERGIELLRTCQDTLKDAELRVKQLVKKHGKEALISFEEDPD